MSGLAIAAFALGIGVTNAVFGIFDSVVLGPLPYPSSDRTLSAHRLQPACATCPASFGASQRRARSREQVSWPPIEWSGDAVDLKNGSYHPLSVPVSGNWFGAMAGWLPDSRHLVARLAEGVGIIDTTNSPWRIIAPAESGDVVRLSRNGRVLLVEHEILDADIWLIELP